MAKYGFVTADGFYYEAERKLDPSHIQVALRSSEQAQPHLELPPQPLPIPVVREIPQTPPPTPVTPREDQNSYRLDENTQFKFKLKDIVVVVSFIVSIAISWNNNDTKMTRLGDQVEQIKASITSIKDQQAENMRKRDELWRRQEDMNRDLLQQINDVERATYTGERKRK